MVKGDLNMNSNIKSWYLDNLKRKEQRRKLVSSTEYLDWLAKFIIKTFPDGFADDCYLYDKTVSDDLKEKVEALSELFDYILELANKEHIDLYSSDDMELSVCFKYKNQFYIISRVVGQGSFTTIALCKDDLKQYVVLDDQEREQIKKEKDKELIQYILVNTDLKMSTGKIAAQVGHACTLCALAEQNNKNFKKWLEEGQTKIILGASADFLMSLKSKYYSIVDKGLTEIPKGSLTVVSLGVKQRGKVQDIVGNLHLL